MLSKINELQDILNQPWFMVFEPDVDDEGYTDSNIFTGEIATSTTGDHVCFVQGNRINGDETLANLIIAAKEVYVQARVLTDVNHHDDYVVPAPEMDAFLRAMEEMIMRCAGW